MAKTTSTLQIDRNTQDQLQLWAKSSKLEHRYVLRALIILMKAEGASYDFIQNKLNISRALVAKWIKRFKKRVLTV